VEYQAVNMGSKGLQIAPSAIAARAMADYPTLIFQKSGYDDTTYAMTSSTVTGVTVTMMAPTTCDLPSTFKWKDYGKPVASPQNGWAAIKDFTHVFYNGMHYIHMTYYTTGWNSATIAPFATWDDANNAKQTSSSTGVAPELMYFTPKKVWINSKQWCSGGSFCWMEATDLSKPSSFALKGNLLTEKITDESADPIDQTLICDDSKCYIFYADDNGRIYSGSMPKANFPGTFTGTKKIIQDTKTNLFEAVEVYKLKGQKKYLMIVECAWTRYFRAFTATDLGGTWTPLGNTVSENTPFAGAKNVTGGWSNDISHGDLIRSSYDEYREVDPCNLQLLYQGYKSPFSGDYGLTPYQMGLLTLQK
jgi:endo-1,4-beta-xylanase